MNPYNFHCFRTANPSIFKALSTQQPLSMFEVMTQINRIISYEGKDSYAKKYSGFMKILNTKDPSEAKYLIKILSGTLRLGISFRTWITALQECQRKYTSREFDTFIASLEKEVFGYNIQARPEHLTLNIPISSMLGKSAKNFKELEKFVMKQSVK